MNTNKLFKLGMLSGLAYASLLFIRIPIIPEATFLRYDIKDVFILTAGILYGTTAVFMTSVVVAFLQALLLSQYGWIGLVMNIASSLAFALPVAKLCGNQYCINRRLIIGLLVGCLSMTITMILWNYILTPLFMGIPRTTVVKMLIPIVIPFNLIKSILNSLLFLVIIKALIQWDVFNIRN